MPDHPEATDLTGSDVTQSYLTLAAPARAEIDVRRSRFVCDVEPVTSEDAARTAIEGVRSGNRDAGHHAVAFVLGPNGATVRANDDGEPSGTAGAPMLDVLRGHGLTDLVAVVSRWFGGTLLGTGGLIRAYADTVTAALDDATLRRRELYASMVVALDHVHGPRLEHALRSIRGVQVGDVDYSPTGMQLHLVVAPAGVGAVTAMIAEISSGAAVVTPGAMSWVDVPIVP